MPHHDTNKRVPHEVDWAEIRRTALSNTRSPPEWPKGVHPISWDGTALLGLDKNLTLYWDGKVVEVKKTVSLNLWQNVLANVAALSAFAVAIVEVGAFVINQNK